jgi:hypothetical protein
VHAGGDDRVQVAFGQVRTGERDLGRLPPVFERVVDLPGRAHVEAYEPQRAHEREHLGVPLCLQRQAQAEWRPDAFERVDQRSRLFLDPDEVVDEQRCPVLARQDLCVAAGDEQPSFTRVEPGPAPPGGSHVGKRC